jgi:hypothetical protein
MRYAKTAALAVFIGMIALLLNRWGGGGNEKPQEQVTQVEPSTTSVDQASPDESVALTTAESLAQRAAEYVAASESRFVDDTPSSIAQRKRPFIHQSVEIEAEDSFGGNAETALEQSAVNVIASADLSLSIIEVSEDGTRAETIMHVGITHQPADQSANAEEPLSFSYLKTYYWQLLDGVWYLIAEEV